MRCKIVRFQKLMWRKMMRSTKNKKTSILHYSILKKLRFLEFDPTKKLLKLLDWKVVLVINV